MALTFLASEPEQLHRFLAVTGLNGAELRSAAGDPAFFAGLLDFILANEACLLAFCQSADLAPRSVERARKQLAQVYDTVPQ